MNFNQPNDYPQSEEGKNDLYIFNRYQLIDLLTAATSEAFKEFIAALKREKEAQVKRGIKEEFKIDSELAYDVIIESCCSTVTTMMEGLAVEKELVRQGVLSHAQAQVFGEGKKEL
jgi:hypothetical protein